MISEYSNTPKVFLACLMTKEGVSDTPSVVASLIGRWKGLVFMNGTRYWGTHDLEVTRYSSHCVFEAELIGTSRPSQDYTETRHALNTSE